MSLLNNLAFNRKILKNESRQNASNKTAIFFPKNVQGKLMSCGASYNLQMGRFRSLKLLVGNSRNPKSNQGREQQEVLATEMLIWEVNSFLRWMQVSHNDGEYFWVVL